MPYGNNTRLQGLMPSTQAPLAVSAAKTLTPADTLVHLTVGSTYTVKMPDVGECQGLTFTIYCVSRSSTYAVTLAEYASGNSLGWADKTIDAAGEKQVLKSDGKTWTFIESIG